MDEPKPELYLGFGCDKENRRAARILLKRGIHFVTRRDERTPVPELRIGEDRYSGVSEIHDYAEDRSPT